MRMVRSGQNPVQRDARRRRNLVSKSAPRREKAERLLYIWIGGKQSDKRV